LQREFSKRKLVGNFRICGGDPNFSILEVESTEDLCLTRQTGAVCSRGSTEEGRSGEEAARQHASPAVDVLGGNPQAAQNVAGESPRHAPQPVAAAPHPVPPLTDPSTVPLLESNTPTFASTENAPPTTLPETLPISGNIISEESAVGVARSLPASLTEDCSSSAEMQRLPASLCPPVPSQIDKTVQELQYGSQTDKEKSHSNSQTNQLPREGAGLVVITGTKEKRSITLEYKPETGTNMELGGKEHTGGNILPQQPKSQICFTASSLSVQDAMEGGAVEQSDRTPPVQTNQSSHIPPSGAAEQAGSLQDSASPALLLSSAENREIKQTNLSKTQPKTIKGISANARDVQKTAFSESVEHIETQPHSAEILEAAKARELLPGIYTSTGKGSSASSCGPLEGAQVESSTSKEQADSSGPTVLQEISSKPSTGPALFDTGLVVSLQAGEVIKAETSHTSDQVASTELIAEIVHSADTQEIVVVGEEAHITGAWPTMHLNQSYLLQREDGSVCEAAIVNELTSEISAGEPKLYTGSVQTQMELGSQPVEVYEFCSLVEEVAEETVCASSAAQMPHSPGYEVNLFNALLENSEDLEASIHTVGENNTIIISQQPLRSTSDINQACSSSNLSIRNTSMAGVEQHLVLDANQAVEVAHSSAVCLVEVAAVTADSFTVEQADTSAQIGTQVGADQTEVSGAAVLQTVGPKQEAEVTVASLSLLSPVVTITSGNLGMQAPVAVTLSHIGNQPSLNQTPGVTVVSVAKPEVCVSACDGTKESPAVTTTASVTVQNVAMPSVSKPVAFRAAPGAINPKLLLLKPGETPLLKHPPSFSLSKQQNADGKLANAHGSCSWSGTVSEECLPQTVSALSSCSDQTQQAVNELSVVAAAGASVKLESGNISLEPDPATPATPSTTTTSKPEALTVSRTLSQDVSTTAATLHSSNMLTASVSASTSPGDFPSQPDSIYGEEDGEDIEHDDPAGETEVQESNSGQVSSPEEGSDDEPDGEKSEMTTPSSPHKHGQSRTDRQALFLKVRQWIADRVTGNSSPGSPSTFSYPGSSTTPDWSTPRRERSSPLRGPHGKFVSPSSLGAYSSSSSPPDQGSSQRSRSERHTDMAELAKHEADIEHRTQALKREGFWSMKRLTRLTEPPRPKVHWDYLCEEMQWLSADFAQERRWKRGVARKVVRMVMRHHEELRQKEEKAKRDEHAKIRRVASSIAKEVRAFWSSVEKVVQYKQQSRLEEKRKKALDLQLDFIVGQTEKYSDLLSKSLAPIRPAETVVSPQKSLPNPVEEDDRDFEPPCEEEDDEETIEVEEQQEGNDAESHRREIELLKEEGMLPLDQLLSSLNLPQDQGSDEECSDETSSSEAGEEEDGEFTANEEDAEDEEDTIAAQEKVEGNVDHAEELDDLAKEGDMSMEELLEKYKGAYASDFEVPSASGSKASSDSEVSGDEEVETEEDESDVESNTSSSDSPGDSAEDEESEKDEEESEEEDEEECGDEGMEVLLKEGDSSPSSSGSRPKKEISHIAATAESLQPKGYTLATTKVKTPIPFLLHGTLREYQHIGLDWLVTMYEKKLNGILADEMGLGKTIQTIALLAHLACEKGNWGPHLIIVPTSVMLNWEMELKRWCPGFKILTYFGSQKERKLKRQGWTKPNAFHVCITSYKLVLQDHQAFRRKSWRYLILDEAQNIKNFKSQRWQSLLNFNRTGMIEGSQEYNEGLVKRLHKVLRPFLLRRIKADVEKQMPKKYEHVVRCRLSKRQRFLYDDFMAQASTRETLASGHFMSVINILMQLRKVCNHPNLFDPRPIQSPFIMQPIIFHTASLVHDALEVSPLKRCDVSMFDLVGLESRVSRYQADVFLPRYRVSRQLIQEIMESPEPPPRPKPVRMKVNRMFQPPPKGDNRPVLLMNKPTCSVPPAAQTPKPPPVTEVTSAPAPAPVVQQVVCSVASTPPRPSLHPTAQTAVRSNAPKPMLTVRPPTAPCTATIPAQPSPNPSNVMPQRVLLSPDMQARLPCCFLFCLSAAPAQVSASSSAPKTSATPRESSSSSQTAVSTKSKSNLGAKAFPPPRKVPRPAPRSPFYMSWLADSEKQQHDSRLDFIFRVNELHCGAKPMYGQEVLDFLTFLPGRRPSPAALNPQGEWGRSGQSSCLYAQQQNEHDYWFHSHAVREAIHSIEGRLELLSDIIDRYTFAIPPVEAPPISMHCCHPPPSLNHKQAVFSSMLSAEVTPLTRSLHHVQSYMRTQFPDLRLIQYDCGKLQTLHTLLRKLKAGGHRVLIFTQMTRMLDVLEQFLNYHGHIYLRLDGSTRVEQRQALMERFNADRRIFCFILSTRSGGVGVNLTGADTVVFYDSDWNPTMDAQAQDRCHRIGQTRDVHIYRLISERTVEENILKKANQKRMLGDMAIEGGNFTTAFFKQQTIRELFDVNEGEKREAAVELSVPQAEEEEAVNKQSTTILEQALCRAEDEEDIVAASQAKAEQVAELAEFNENIPLDDGGEQEEVEELSKAEQEIAALVEQLTPIERYAMNFLEASLEDVCKEELKQAEEQVEAARKGLDQAKEEGLKLHTSSDDDEDDFLSTPTSAEPAHPAPARRGRKPKDKTATSTRTSGRLRGASPETEPEPTTPREVPERSRSGLRGRGAAKDTGSVSTIPSRTDHHKTSSSTRVQDSSKSSKASATPSPPVHPQPVRGYPPYSPPHLSPDMPVLRNLPVRRRLETESRMAAQMGEQHLGRGRGANQSKKTDIPPGRDAASASAAESSVNSLMPPLKRKRGRPPKTPTRLPELDNASTTSPHPISAIEEGIPPLSPKRKRGRPRKDSATTLETVNESQNSNLSKTDSRTELTISETPPPAAIFEMTRSSQSTKADQTDTKTEALAPPPNPASSTKSDEVSTPVSLPTSPAPQVTSLISDPASSQVVASAPAPSPAPAPVLSSSTYTSTPVSNTAPSPPVSDVPPPPPGVKPTLVVSTVSDAAVQPAVEATTTTTTPITHSTPPTTSSSKAVKDPTPTLTTAATTVSVTVSITPQVTTAMTSPPTASLVKDLPQASLASTPSSHPVSSLDTASPKQTPPTTASPKQTSPAPSLPKQTSPAPSLPKQSLQATASPKQAPVATPSPKQTSPAPPSPKQTSPAPPSPKQTSPAPPSPKQTSPAPPSPKQTSPAPPSPKQTSPAPPLPKQTSPAPPSPKQNSPAPPSPKQTSPAPPSPKQTPPATSTTVTAPVKTAQTSMLDSIRTVSDKTSTSPPVKTVAPSSGNTAPPSPPAKAKTIETANKSPTEQASPTAEVQEHVEPEKPSASSPVCTPPPTTPSTSAATPAEAKKASAASSPPAEGVTTPSTAAPSKVLTSSSSPPKTAEKTDKTPPVTATTSASPSVTIATSSPEKSASLGSTTTTITPASIATVTASTTKTAPPVSTTQTSAVTSSQLQTSSSTSVPAPSQTEEATPAPISAPSSTPLVAPSLEPSTEKESASKSDQEEVTEMEAEAAMSKEDDDKKSDFSQSQPKRRKVESSSETKESGRPQGVGRETKTTTPIPKDEANPLEEEKTTEDQKPAIHKRSLSRQSSQESARSSSPSSGCSTSTLTRHAHHKRTYENRHPTKKRRVDPTSEAGKEDKEEQGEEEKIEGGSETDLPTTASRRRRSRSPSSSSSDSDSSNSRKEHRLTRSAKRRLQDQEKEKCTKDRKGAKPASSSDRNSSNNTNASTGGESGSDTSSVRITRKSVGSQPPQDTKTLTNSTPSLPPEPEVLGKRCSALNAAAKLLAMKGRVDTPGHTPRKDSTPKAPATSTTAPSDKNQKPKSKSVPASPQSNSVTNNKSSKPSTPNQASRSTSRSTRQCPGSLVPPLEVEYKRPKPEEKERGSRKSSRGKEGEGETRSSSRGHSACSSMSSDGEGDCGGRSSRSRSSSNSSQRTLSSQNTEHRGSRSRATSSGSERERDRSSERAKSRDKKEKQQRESRKERRSQKLSQDVTSSSGTEGSTPDRVLRSVAALAAVQARSPAASTRSSSSQQRHNKT
ncbi:helicase SRCAP, partial [Neolamprologus brichardi]